MQLAASTIQRYKNSRADGGVTILITVPLIFAKSTLQRYKNARVNIGVTNLQCPCSLQRLPYKDTKFKTELWRYKLTVCLEICKNSTVQRYKNSRVDVGFTNLGCHGVNWNLQSLPYKDTKIQWQTLALQTYSVIETCKVYRTKLQKKGWTLALLTYNAQSILQRYQHSRVYNFTVSLTIAKSTIQNYINSRVDVGVTNLQCPWNLQSLYHTTIPKFQGGRWRYRLTVSLTFA